MNDAPQDKPAAKNVPGTSLFDDGNIDDDGDVGDEDMGANV